MPESEWYCRDCDTHGGGPPNHQTMQEHVDEVHSGLAARIIEGDYKDWERKQNYRNS